jgi:hypothetical protein
MASAPGLPRTRTPQADCSADQDLARARPDHRNAGGRPPQLKPAPYGRRYRSSVYCAVSKPAEFRLSASYEPARSCHLYGMARHRSLFVDENERPGLREGTSPVRRGNPQECSSSRESVSWGLLLGGQHITPGGITRSRDAPLVASSSRRPGGCRRPAGHASGAPNSRQPSRAPITAASSGSPTLGTGVQTWTGSPLVLRRLWTILDAVSTLPLSGPGAGNGDRTSDAVPASSPPGASNARVRPRTPRDSA